MTTRRPACARCRQTNAHIVTGTGLCIGCWTPPHDDREPEAVPDHEGGRARAPAPPADIRDRIIAVYRARGSINAVQTALGLSRLVVSETLRAAGEMRAPICQRGPR